MSQARRTQFHDDIQSGVKKEQRAITAIGRFLHAHPEVAHKEHLASERIAGYLEAIGFSVTKPYAGLDTAFRAVLKGKGRGPRVAVFAEYDALPGLGHGCGHNLITVTALAAAAGVRATKKPFAGAFEIIGTPAEENFAGKDTMIQAGAFDHLDAAMMTHPSQDNKITLGSLANRDFTARFYGKAAHAAAAPQQGINALSAAIGFFNQMQALRQHLREDARINAIITRGGDVINVIPELAEIEVEVRSLDEAYLADLCKRVERCVRTSASAVGARVKIQWKKTSYRAFRHNDSLDSVLVDAYGAQGIALQRFTGTESRGSLDMGNVSRILPAAHPSFSIVPKGQHAALHTREFLAYANTPYAYKQALRAGAGMAEAALRLLTEPALAKKTKMDFNRP